ncbi:MAG: FAD-dependent monooxygenase [Flavobacteriales bacterium]|nr:FAD-dependent monooxygenase [Flavobacteriales bacterium]
MSKKVTIVGAGLVGSLLACYLGRRGYQVAVYEKRPDLRKKKIVAGKSINLACSTRGWRALDAVGVGDIARAHAIPMKGRMLHSVEGNLSFQPYGIDDQAIYSISRGGLNKILMDYAEQDNDVTFHYDQKCMHVDVDSATATFVDYTTKEEKKVEADILIGADGAFSRVRGIMQRLPHFDYTQDYIDSDYKELSIPDLNGDFRMEKEALHIWPRGRFMLIALPNGDGSFTCTLFMPYEGENSFKDLTDAKAARSFFEKIFPDAIAQMPTFDEDWNENPQAPLVIIRCYPWSWKDKVTLIGDASHAIVPFYGQGMNSGFEDCYVFDQMIDEFDGDFSKILPEFGKRRKPNADAIADLALYNYQVMADSVNDEGFLLRKKLEHRIMELYPERYKSLYSMVTFSHIPYAEAQQKGFEQDEYFKGLIQKHDIEGMFDRGEIDDFIHTLFKTKETII